MSLFILDLTLSTFLFEYFKCLYFLVIFDKSIFLIWKHYSLKGIHPDNWLFYTIFILQEIVG